MAAQSSAVCGVQLIITEQYGSSEQYSVWCAINNY